MNFYRAMQNREPAGIAQAVALTFMGCRAEKWPKERLAGMAVFFSQVGYKTTGEWKEEIVIFDPTKAGDKPAAERPTAVFPDGTPGRAPAGPRSARGLRRLARSRRRIPWFARNIVNRVWSWLLGRGIIHEPDDIRPDNPPSNPELLAYLERELVASRYDLKHVYRLILNSKTYQLSSIPRASGPKAEAEFACYPLRRLEAEVLIDALNQITGTTEKYSSPIPEPFTFIPEDQRSIALADGSITQLVPGDVRPAAARHGPGIGAEQPPHRRPAAAPAEFEPHPAEDRAEPEAAGAAAIARQAPRDRRPSCT